MLCKICGRETHNRTFEAKEMMFGIPKSFSYFECQSCGCLQITEVPTDLSKYYESSYFTSSDSRNFSLKLGIERWMFRINKVLKKRIIHKFLFQAFEPPYILNLMREHKLHKNSTILEVGPGQGSLLSTLHAFGFKHLEGVEPYSKPKVNSAIKIMKGTLTQLSLKGKYDLIIFNHSLEHIPDQFDTLKRASELLSDDGTCLIRIPVKTDYIWKRYGTFWVQLDAPRHFYLHTLKSFKILSNKSGLTVEKGFFDSTDFQFWGSEQYLKNIFLKSNKSYMVNPKASIFSKKQIKEFSKRAKELNKIGQGDQAAFYLKKNESAG